MGNIVYPKYKAWKANGTSPAAGYYLYTYFSGTTIPKSTYADGSLTPALNANPIVLDSNGEANIFPSDSGAYRFDLKTPAGALINSFDPVASTNGSGVPGAIIGYVETIAALKAIAITVAAQVEVQGYYTKGDGGGGKFYFDPASAAVDNLGTVVIPASAPATGRWIRLYSDPFALKWFGWTGAGGAQDTAGQAAFNTLSATLTANSAQKANEYTFKGQVNLFSSEQNIAEPNSVHSPLVLRHVGGITPGNNRLDGIIFADVGEVIDDTNPNLQSVAYIAMQGADFEIGNRYGGSLELFSDYHASLFANSGSLTLQGSEDVIINGTDQVQLSSTVVGVGVYGISLTALAGLRLNFPGDFLVDKFIGVGQRIVVAEANGLLNTIPFPAVLTGSGTTGYIPSWTSGTTLGNSALAISGGILGNTAGLTGINVTVANNIIFTGNGSLDMACGTTLVALDTSAMFLLCSGNITVFPTSTFIVTGLATISGTLSVTANVGIGGTATAENLDVYFSSISTVTSLIRNTSATVNAHARLGAYVNGASGGDPLLLLNVVGVTSWSVGVDNSDSDIFKIGSSSAVGTSTWLQITTAGIVALAGRLNINGATDIAGYSLNILNGGVGISGGNSFVSFGLGTPADSNVEFFQALHDGANAYLRSSKSGTGSYRPLLIQNGGATAITVATNQGVQLASTLGVTGTIITTGTSIEIRNDASANINNELNSSNTNAPIFRSYKSRGTNASKTDVANGDYASAFASSVWSGGAYYAGAEIDFAVDGTFTSGQRPPSRMEFWTNLANGAQTKQLSISGAGTVAVTNNATVGGTLGVTGASTLTGNVALAGRLNIGGATDANNYAINSAAGHIAASGTWGLQAYGVGVPGAANAEYLYINHNGATPFISVDKAGSGSYRGLEIKTGGSTAITVATNQGVQLASTLGVTGVTTLSSNATVGGTLGVTGLITATTLTASGLITANGNIVANGSIQHTAASTFEIVATSTAGGISISTQTVGSIVLASNSGTIQLTANGLLDLRSSAVGITIVDTSGGGVSITGVVTCVDRLNTRQSVAASASLRVPHGSAPTTPGDGDMWSTNIGLYFRLNGVTKSITMV